MANVSSANGFLVVDAVGDEGEDRASRSSATTEADGQLDHAAFVGRRRRLDRRGLDWLVQRWRARPLVCAAGCHVPRRHRLGTMTVSARLPDRASSIGVRPMTLPSVSTRGEPASSSIADLARACARKTRPLSPRTRLAERLPAGQQRGQRPAGPDDEDVEQTVVGADAAALRPGRHRPKLATSTWAASIVRPDPVEGDRRAVRSRMLPVSRIGAREVGELAPAPLLRRVRALHHVGVEAHAAGDGEVASFAADR